MAKDPDSGGSNRGGALIGGAGAGFMFPFSARALREFGAARHIASSRGLSGLLSTGGVRMLADAMSRKPGPGRVVKPGDLCAVGLICNILHFVSGLYRRTRNPAMLEKMIDEASADPGPAAVEHATEAFVGLFPPAQVALGAAGGSGFLESSTGGTPNRLLCLEAMLLLGIFNENPAFRPFMDLFDDSGLARDPEYRRVLAAAERSLDGQPPFGPFRQPLHRMLKAPAEASPNSLQGQLDYIRLHWGLDVLGEMWESLLHGLDLLAEEKNFFSPSPGQAQSAFSAPAGYSAFEPEAFSMDLDWMPGVVLMAKSVYVWLFQLSRKYQRRIDRLDLIPDEELDLLARWGFTGLWLIGLWERSPASREIKRRMGNPEAEASAYSIYDYEIAADLGGEAAFQDLKARAMQRGLRLAGDMVPNHMGVSSKWVAERPELFMQRDDPPFPWYSFTGPDLSNDGRVTVQIEDKYWARSDAAVVFRRIDRSTGRATYVYHGNDGTGMPWNDTAQLDYLKAGTRRAVLDAILRVASKFPIIRFDAAMTLAKKHFERLWYPEHGEGGAIPTRAEYAMPRGRFDELFPAEFWREVVDAVAARMPDTLLLAEAFWLMEGFFVRTLGMHRVYNSAFMNMLKAEDNAKYRRVMKNVLDFNPEVLRRFVNFMNNPDEDTAVAQFGKDDKYFGVAAMMCTMPGLPMFGHGQIEGFTEKYGMEYRRSYSEERPDEGFVQRHEREIFPLLRMRRLWSGVENFRLFDFERHDGSVNEDVFAYSNGLGAERGLFVYNNRFQHASGSVRSMALGGGSLMSALGFGPGPDSCIRFRDQVSGLHFLARSGNLEENGLALDLGAFKRSVFVEFREIRGGDWQRLADRLAGSGVPDLEDALRGMLLDDVSRMFEDFFRKAAGGWAGHEPGEAWAPDRFEEGLRGLAEACDRMPGFPRRAAGALEEAAALLRAASILKTREPAPCGGPGIRPPHERAVSGDLAFVFGSAFFCAAAMRMLVAEAGQPPGFDLPDLAARAASARGPESARRAADLARILHELIRAGGAGGGGGDFGLAALLGNPACASFLGFNSWNGALWFSKERFGELVSVLAAASAIADAASGAARDAGQDAAARYAAAAGRLLAAAEASGYRADMLAEALERPAESCGDAQE